MDKSAYSELAGLRLDRVFTFGDQLSFLIPHDWEDLDEAGDHYCYADPDRAWLRVSLITSTGSGKGSEAEISRTELQNAEKNGRMLYKIGQNLVTSWKEYSEREGEAVTNHNWTVVRGISDDVRKAAIFTYTVPASRPKTRRNEALTEFIGELVSQSKFPPADPIE